MPMVAGHQIGAMGKLNVLVVFAFCVAQARPSKLRCGVAPVKVAGMRRVKTPDYGVSVNPCCHECQMPLKYGSRNFQNTFAFEGLLNVNSTVSPDMPTAWNVTDSAKGSSGWGIETMNAAWCSWQKCSGSWWPAPRTGNRRPV